MKIKQLAKREMDELDKLCFSFLSEVEVTVSKFRNKKFKFYILPKNERYRLLRLRVWMERYQVDLYYILSKLLPWWEQFVQRRSKKLKSEGLGVRVATLTGKKSEQMLQLFISQDFPLQQHTLMQRIHRQNIILNRELDKSEDGIKTASDFSRNIFDFPHPRGYVQYYRRRIRRHALRREHIVQEMKTRPYRGNPFVE